MFELRLYLGSDGPHIRVLVILQVLDQLAVDLLNDGIITGFT